MAGASLFTLIDDIATLLDDIAAMSKVAAKKTAGVLGDDLALNAQQVSGVTADRELPVVWAVAKGSLFNKIILVPAALLISAFLPMLIVPMLMIGGLFLCYEGAHKFAESYLAPAQENPRDNCAEPQSASEYEKQKISGAIRTDFILSAEIIVISLGTVAGASLFSQFTVLSIIALVMTVGVYGIVALIVKIDDAGLYLLTHNKPKSIAAILGAGLVNCAPYLMKTLSIVGTLAMFMVGGGILSHGLHFIAVLEGQVSALLLPYIVTWLAWMIPALFNGLFGFLAGLVVVGVIYCAAVIRKAVTRTAT